MWWSSFIFDSVQLLHYKCNKINFSQGESYIDSPDWIEKKKAAINPKNADDKSFQYAVTVALNQRKSKKQNLKQRKRRLSLKESYLLYWKGKMETLMVIFIA